MKDSVVPRILVMFACRFSMAFQSVLTMSTNIYFDSAWEFYKFVLSMATGFLIFSICWSLFVEDSFLHFIVALTAALFGGIVVYLKNVEKYIDEDDPALYQGNATQKRKPRRDGVHDFPEKDSTDTSDETSPHHSSSEGSLKDSPVVEPPRKNCRRHKKKRNSLKSNKSKYKSTMDDSSETSSNNDSYPKIETHIEKTKVYTPLKMYLKLNLDLYDMYHEFRPYLLTYDQLKMYGFPMESPDNPGRITPDPKLIKGSTERRCCRCGSLFYILADGIYKSESSCHYHPRKPLPYRKDCPYRGDFPCCNGNYMSEGCLAWQYHVSAESFLHDVDFVKARSKKHLNEVTACTIYAMDCEMLFTTAGMEVAKVGIVGVDGLTVFESFVLPQNKVLDYNTVYSGVTEKDLKGVTTTLVDVQTYLLKLLNKDSILVGHGLENDLKVLRLIHGKVVDTSVAFPLPHSKFHKKSLKVLAKEFLNKHIQQSLNGHDCIEDARTCMELMLYKISIDLKTRLPFTQDENKNSILQNMQPQQPQAPIIQNSWPYSCNFPYYSSDSYGDNFYSGYLMPKTYYQKSCIY